MKKYILFDHDGVLVDTERWYYLANKRAFEAFNIELELEPYLQNMSDGISSWVLAREAGIDEKTISEKRKQRDNYYQEYLISEDIEIPGIVDTLAKLSSNYKMAIVTTSKRADFDLIHRRRNIQDFMEFVLTVEDYNHAKPDPEPYLTALERFDALAAEAVVIEDSAIGLKSSVAAGIDCIVIDNKFTISHDFSTATKRASRFTELPGMIKELS